VCEEKRESESHPKPRPKPKPSSADVAERGVAWIGVRTSGNLCVDEEYAPRIKDEITGSAGKPVHGLNTTSLSKASRRWQEKQLERIVDGKSNY
jgi:hypothetical protein